MRIIRFWPANGSALSVLARKFKDNDQSWNSTSKQKSCPVKLNDIGCAPASKPKKVVYLNVLHLIFPKCFDFGRPVNTRRVKVIIMSPISFFPSNEYLSSQNYMEYIPSLSIFLMNQCHSFFIRFTVYWSIQSSEFMEKHSEFIVFMENNSTIYYA